MIRILNRTENLSWKYVFQSFVKEIVFEKRPGNSFQIYCKSWDVKIPQVLPSYGQWLLSYTNNWKPYQPHFNNAVLGVCKSTNNQVILDFILGWVQMKSTIHGFEGTFIGEQSVKIVLGPRKGFSFSVNVLVSRS